MNPYSFANLINPVAQSDWRESEKSIHNTGLDYSMSRAFFRAVNSVGRIMSKRVR